MTEPTRDEKIIGLYKGKIHADEIGRRFGITGRQVQRVIHKAGVTRPRSESYRLAIEQGRMTYHRIPQHLKKQRKRLSDKLRYKTLEDANYTCVKCGATPTDGYRIEVDHIDDDATNNQPDNLQVLCSRCNKGKAFNPPQQLNSKIIV